MSRLRLYQCDAEQRDGLIAAGHELTEDKLCDAVVINLARLPSHGKEVAAAMRAAKATRHIPIVFVDGLPEKVAGVRELLPDAIYTSWPNLPRVLKKLKPLENPVVPHRMMNRYAHRTAAQKLGIAAKSRVSVVDAPRDYWHVLGDLPPDVTISEESEPAEVTLCFVRDPDALAETVTLGGRIAGDTKFWICWPKGKKSALTDKLVRKSALDLGLVDYKICSLDETWSGMAFAAKDRRSRPKR